ncbi:hypothetical protein SAMN04488003_101239 [Loktanella fryxellensis]|uniref:Uncharacterized protein n=1 Tax=Loktanella fryxellensis TaxID=245187 RepID=A0A1H7YND3_9RHOB|nr:hypothetical protein [Loktanella fryxellensis]SEM47451.1 hypothetical protein SAMN04488003_101239 [Loktanella fryxellensis]
MDAIRTLEGRITAALDRIAYGLDQQARAPDPQALAAELQAERDAHAALTDRVVTLKARQDDQIAALQARVADQAAQLASLDAELQQVRGSNADLTVVCGELRRAAMDGVADATLVNRALMAEVDGLTVQRSSEAAEVAAILSDLKPLLRKEG